MPRYEIIEETQGGFPTFRLKDNERKSEAIVVPEFGNNCTEYRTTPGNAQNSEMISEMVDVFVPPVKLEDLRNSPFASGNPILFFRFQIVFVMENIRLKANPILWISCWQKVGTKVRGRQFTVWLPIDVG